MGRAGEAIEAFVFVRYRLLAHSGMVIATRDSLPGTEDFHHDIGRSTHVFGRFSRRWSFFGRRDVPGRPGAEAKKPQIKIGQIGTGHAHARGVFAQLKQVTDDFELVGYQSHPPIKAPIAV